MKRTVFLKERKIANARSFSLFLGICIMSMTVLLGACSKDDDGDNPIANNELAGTWQLKALSGSASYINGTSPYNVTKVVNDELPADMTSYNQAYTFKSDGKCVMDGDNGTYTFANNVLTTKVGNNTMVFTVLSVNSSTLKLQMDKATSKVYAIEVANTLLKEAGDPKNCAEYGIGATDASFTFDLIKK